MLPAWAGRSRDGPPPSPQLEVQPALRLSCSRGICAPARHRLPTHCVAPGPQAQCVRAGSPTGSQPDRLSAPWGLHVTLGPGRGGVPRPAFKQASLTPPELQEPSVKPSRSMLRSMLSIRAVPVPVAKRLCERCPALPQEAAALSLVLVRPAKRADFRDRRGSVEQSACEDARSDGYRRRPLASPLPAARRASEGYSRSYSHHRQVGPSRGAEAADCRH